MDAEYVTSYITLYVLRILYNCIMLLNVVPMIVIYILLNYVCETC